MDFKTDLMSEEEFARDVLSAGVRTAQRMRARREGPPFLRLSRKVYYRREAVAQWLLDQEQVQPRAGGQRHA